MVSLSIRRSHMHSPKSKIQRHERQVVVPPLARCVLAEACEEQRKDANGPARNGPRCIRRGHQQRGWGLSSLITQKKTNKQTKLSQLFRWLFLSPFSEVFFFPSFLLPYAERDSHQNTYGTDQNTYAQQNRHAYQNANADTAPCPELPLCSCVCVLFEQCHPFL